MDKPLAFKINDSNGLSAHFVGFEKALIAPLPPGYPNTAPALIIARKASFIPAVKAGIVDYSNVVAVQDGNWSEAILVILPEVVSQKEVDMQTKTSGDSQFLGRVRLSAPSLIGLATQTIASIRAAGVEGDLIEVKGSAGRWVNSPLNIFTLKAQPRKNDLAFTMYGNPDSYDEADGFLRKDQNSYSRGWVRNSRDVAVLVELLKKSQARRKR